MLLKNSCSCITSIQVDLTFDDGSSKSNIISVNDIVDVVYVGVKSKAELSKFLPKAPIPRSGISLLMVLKISRLLSQDSLPLIL